MNAVRISRPSLVRIGMFCRLGSEEASRPRRRRAERIAGVDAPGLGMHVARQRVRVGRAQLRELAPFEHRVDEPSRIARQVLVLAEVVEEPSARLPLAALRALAARQLQPLEQDLAELARRAQVELVADEAVDLLLEPRDALRECRGQAREDGAVDPDAGPLHLGDHGHERALERLVDRRHALGGEPRLQHLPEP